MDLELHHYSMETAETSCEPFASALPMSWHGLRKANSCPWIASLRPGLRPSCILTNEAREVARWAKFAPLGKRGVDGANTDDPYCSVPLVPYLKHS